MPKSPRAPEPKTDATDRRDVTVHLPVDLHRAVKVFAAQHDRSMSSVIEEAVRVLLSGVQVTEH